MLQKKMDLFEKIIFRTGFMPRGIGRARVSGLRSNEGESRNPGKPVKNGLLAIFTNDFFQNPPFLMQRIYRAVRGAAGFSVKIAKNLRKE